MSDMVKISYHIEGSAVKLGGFHGEIEIDPADLPEDDPDERERVIARFVENEVQNEVQWGWEEVLWLTLTL